MFCIPQRSAEQHRSSPANSAKCRMHDGHSCILHETEKFNFYKMLICKDFYKKQYWHNHCTYHSMPHNTSQWSR